MRIARLWYNVICGGLLDVSVGICSACGTSLRHCSNLCVSMVMFAPLAKPGDASVFAISAAIKLILLVCVCMHSSIES
jgi:hypothetical protein